VERPKAEGEDANFARIHISLLVKTHPLSADIYIRLSNSHYVKMFQKEDVFDQEDLKRYREKKKIEYLFLSNQDCPVFIKKLAAELDRLLKANPTPTPKQAAETVDDTIETTHELIAKFGVTEEIQELVTTSMQVTMKSMGDFPQMADVLKNLNQTGKYIGKHSTILTHVACSLAVIMDWYSDATFEKLTMAAFLHDAPLLDHELCAVKNAQEFDKKYKGKFKTAQVQEYMAHPERAALMLGHFKKAPAEVDKIILQHHEHPMGSGFPNQLSSNYISPLGSLFIVAHDLTDYLIESKESPSMEGFFAEIGNKYSSGNFKKIAKVISEVDLFAAKE